MPRSRSSSGDEGPAESERLRAESEGPAPYSPPGYQGIPPRPVYAMRVALAALAQIRAEQPYWNASGGADHLFLFSHDEGACWAPLEVYRRSTNPTILTNLVVT